MEQKKGPLLNNRQAAPPASSPFHEPAPPDPDASLEVTVSAGLHITTLPVANRRVAEIRSRFQTRLDIDRRAVAIVDGNEVSEDYVVRAGQILTFVRRAGEKGVGARVLPYVPFAEKKCQREIIQRCQTPSR